MVTAPAPPSSAARQASSLATMPALACPPPISASIPRSSTVGIVRPSASSTPAVPPAMIRTRARSRAARNPANVSALTLNICPPEPAPRLATTGTWPVPSRSMSNAGGSVPTGRPTNPRSTSVPSAARYRRSRRTRTRAPSAPVRPTALAPAAPSAATRRVLTRPASTPATTSRVGPSVMRSPSTARFGIPSRAISVSTSRPPPCTITSGSRSATSASAVASRRSRAGSSSSSPPSLMTAGGRCPGVTAIPRARPARTRR